MLVSSSRRRGMSPSLSFTGVLSISCPEGKFCLNSTIVDFEAVAAENGLITFRLEMTGGYDENTFKRSLVIEARDFSLTQGAQLLFCLQSRAGSGRKY